MTSGFVSLSAHVEIADDTDPTEVLVPVAQRLQARFGLVHLTLQPETARLHEAMECCHFLDRAQSADVATADGG